MNLWRLIVREMLHRKVNVALAVLSIVVAAATLVGSIVLLKVHDRHTEILLEKKQGELKELGDRLADDARQNMKLMGLNVVVIPKDQNLTDYFADNYASKFMPESYAKKLADSGILSVRHILPSLEQRVRWPERGNRRLILVGVRGEIPLLHRKITREPMVEAVGKKEIVLGSEVAIAEGLKIGDEVELMGRKFTVSKIHKSRGDKQDITAWIDLATAQEMLGKKGLVNAIWALECKCAWGDVKRVRRDIEKILPDTQVLEKRPIAEARWKERGDVDRYVKESLAEEKAGRDALRARREAFAAVLVPIVIVCSAVWIGFLAMNNVRERQVEIGVLRSLGLRTWQIMFVFLGKAVLVGIVGGALGCAAGLLIGAKTGMKLDETTSVNIVGLIQWQVFIVVLVAAPLLSAIASWVPTVVAARQDPAAILCKE